MIFPDYYCATIVNGHTIEIAGQRIRLNGVDAPESWQTCKDAVGLPDRAACLHLQCRMRPPSNEGKLDVHF
jgi:endonuclease YncB( thermonuclease family)